MDNVLDILQERGFVQQISDEPSLHRLLGRRKITLYDGFDPTRPSLTIGNLVGLMMLAWFDRCGHRPIALMGGGTALVGDPSGKLADRPILPADEITANIRHLEGQISRVLRHGPGHTLTLNNAEWLEPLRFIPFMRDIGSRFSVNEVLRLEAYRTRLEAGGLSMLEFSYVLMQSYDFLHLYQNYDCVLQIGGSDQWGNSVAGADLIRKVTGGEAFVLVAPLILTADGVKMGKTEAGAVWLDPTLTTPYEYYQFWRNVADADVERFLALFTFLPMSQIQALGRVQGAALNEAKEVLAFEATRIVHGDGAAEEARAAARRLFAEAGGEVDLPTAEVDCEQLAAGMPVTELFKAAGLVASANEARSLIAQGGLSLNGRPIEDPRARVDLTAMENGALMLARGRKHHKRVICR
ncbi:MAG: tyrosine--tRNA ligase [Chloroflexota bacterium]